MRLAATPKPSREEVVVSSRERAKAETSARWQRQGTSILFLFDQTNRRRRRNAPSGPLSAEVVYRADLPTVSRQRRRPFQPSGMLLGPMLFAPFPSSPVPGQQADEANRSLSNVNLIYCHKPQPRTQTAHSEL
ncbi:hypothetical protein ZHAS_00018279 [Anopheles sinensis]|uniref:Uncharacterized protein n=1 Tax=Anopheles sinensis TaxID=74873 RepID=A0A084WJ17_ANOSI|nr:hypothetical protein ZHAS_00018279 [Anopheles sinensis]